jgi:AraC family transcriptional regulator of adaptative response/methylated-DNA-[protein]-cysteine methyltransferase
MPALRLTYGEARRRDLPQLVALLGVLFAHEAEFAPDTAKQRRALRMLLADPLRGRIYVARRGARVLGMASVLRTVSTAEGGPAGLLEDLVVRPGSRGAGIGAALLAFAVERSRAEGLLRLTLLTDRGNRKAQRLYRKAGFISSPMMPMRLKLR